MGRRAINGAGPQQQVKEAQADIDYLPRGRPSRRRPLEDEFDPECGYSYNHDWVFIRFSHYGAREYECGNCGERIFMADYSCDPDIHETLEVGALELAFLPIVHKSINTLREMAKDRKEMAAHNDRRRHKTLEEEEQDV